MIKLRCSTGRLIRQISGQNLVTEVEEDTFAPTPWAASLASDLACKSLIVVLSLGC